MKNKEDKTELRGHSFDGIQEYDNDLPRWWVRLFYITIIFSVPYLLWYHTPFFSGKSLVDEYAAESSLNKAAGASEATAEAIDYTKPDLVAAGKMVFDTNCVACHGANAQGVIGPNLTDDFWIYGNKLSDVTHSIVQGAPAKGMPAWGELLGIKKTTQVVAYIKSIQGATVVNPKAPQGNPGKLE